jgi:hypothetical protein
MPSTILSHQGGVLPLIIKYPNIFDGASLIIGSFIPDLPWFIALFIDSFSERAFHSLGELIIIVPISLLLVIFYKKAISPVLSYFILRKRFRIIIELLGFFGINKYSVLWKKQISGRFIIKAIYSILIGVFSHFLLDLPTHGNIPYLKPFYYGIMPEWFLYKHFTIGIPFFGTIEATNYQILWMLFSIGFGILTLYYMMHIKKRDQ